MKQEEIDKEFNNLSNQKLLEKMVDHNAGRIILPDDVYKVLITHLRDRRPKMSKEELDIFEKNIVVGTARIDRYKYPALRIIAGIYMILSIIVGFVSVISAIYFKIEGNLSFSVIIIVGGGLLSLSILAVSEFIKVFIDIEYNSRRMADKII